MNMEHKLVASPELDRLERAFFSAIMEEKKADPLKPVVILVGSHLLGLYLVRKLAEERGPVINVRFLTLKKLAQELGRERLERKEGKSPLPPELREVLLELALEEQDLQYFKPVRNYPGLRSVLLSAFRDLADADLLLSFIKEGKKPGKKKWGPKFHDLAKCAEGYLSRWQDSYYDSFELFLAAADESNRFVQLFNAERLFVYGIYDFTEVQARLLEELSRVVPLSVFLPWSPGENHRYAKRGLDRYVRFLGKEPELLSGDSTPGTNMLSRVKKLWESGSRESLSGAAKPVGGEESKDSSAGGDPSLLFINAPSEKEEIEEIARTILGLAEDGVSFSEMAVVFRSSEQYLPLIKEVFSTAGIPYYLAERPALVDTELSNALRGLLDLVPAKDEEGFYRPEVVNLFRSGLFQLDEPSDPWAADQLDEWTIEAEIVAGREQWRQGFNRLAEKTDDAEKKKLLERRTAFVFRLFDLLELLPKASSFEQAGEIIDRVFQEFLAPEPASQLSACLNRFRNALLELDSLKAPFAFELLKEVFLNWLGQETIELQPVEEETREGEIGWAEPRGRFQEGAVTVGGIMVMRGLRFNTVFAAGMSAGVFPVAFREDPVLLDAEREELMNRLGGTGSLRLSRDRSSEERLLFALLVESAKERLFLSFPRLKSQGQKGERLPSPFLLECASLTGSAAITYTSFLKGAPRMRKVPLSRFNPAAVSARERAAHPPSRPVDLIEFLKEQIAAREFAEPGKNLCERFPFMESGLRALKERRSSSSNPYSGRILNPELLNFIRERSGRSFSASSLQTYGGCPFRFFVERVVCAQEPALPEEAEFGKLETGDLFHEVLARFMKEAKKEKLLPLLEQDREAMLERLENTFHERWEKLLEEHPSYWSQEIRAEKARLERALPRVYDKLLDLEKDGAGFLPELMEESFSSREEEGIEVEVELEPGMVVTLGGRIDRLDLKKDRSAFRVLDYKTGTCYFKKDERFRCGRELQPAVYLLAGGKISGKGEPDEEDEAGMVYIIKEWKVKRFSGREYVDDAKKLMAEIVRGVQNGLFPPLPAPRVSSEKEICEWCSYKEFCDTAIFRSRVGDSDPAKLVRMKLDKFK